MAMDHSWSDQHLQQSHHCQGLVKPIKRWQCLSASDPQLAMLLGWKLLYHFTVLQGAGYHYGIHASAKWCAARAAVTIGYADTHTANMHAELAHATEAMLLTAMAAMTNRLPVCMLWVRCSAPLAMHHDADQHMLRRVVLLTAQD